MYCPDVGPEKWTIIAINEDEDAGWGEWVVGIEMVDRGLVDEGMVRIEKSRSVAKVSVSEAWKGGDLIITLKQKVDVRVR